MKPGIYSDIPESDYHGDPCDEPSLSSSIAKAICNESPWHAKLQHPRLTMHPIVKQSKAMDIGTIAHQILLGGDTEIDILDYPDWRTKAAKELRDESRSMGRIPVLQKDFLPITQMVESARNQLRKHEASDIFTDGKAGETLIWFDAQFGVWCRARLDWLSNSNLMIDDLKTTSASANPEKTSRTLFDNGYDIQAAFYLRGLHALTGRDADFRFCFIENSPPHALSVISLAPDAMAIGVKKVLWALEKFAHGLKTGEWPGYPNKVCYATLPAWEESRWLKKEEADDI